VILANAKRAISGRYRAFKHSKYARLHLGASQYHRFNLAAMVQRLLRATMLGALCAGPTLCAADHFHS
jgi:hypothetical protein